jgi:LPS-assembly protein
MAEFTLKGLGAFNNKLASLLEQRVVGFNKSNQSWTQSQ